MYAFFSKLGLYKRSVEWLPIFIVRLCVGLFFILSGFFKIFDPTQHEILMQTLQAAEIASAEFFTYFFPLMALLLGILILIGFLTSFSAFFFLVMLVTALIWDHRALPSAHHFSLFFEKLFYIPEVIYILIFLWLFFSGPGKISLDCYLSKKNSDFDSLKKL